MMASLDTSRCFWRDWRVSIAGWKLSTNIKVKDRNAQNGTIPIEECREEAKGYLKQGSVGNLTVNKKAQLSAQMLQESISDECSL